MDQSPGLPAQLGTLALGLACQDKRLHSIDALTRADGTHGRPAGGCIKSADET